MTAPELTDLAGANVNPLPRRGAHASSKERTDAQPAGLGDALCRILLLVLPTLAYWTIWFSRRPGQAGEWHALRLAVVILAGYALLVGLQGRLALGKNAARLAVISLIVTAEALLWMALGDIDVQKAVAQASGALTALGLVLMVGTSARRLGYLLSGVCAGSVTIALVAAWEWRTQQHLENIAGRGWPYGVALGATFINPNNFAAHTAMMAGTLLVFSYRAPRARLLVVPMAVLTAASALTYSRSFFAVAAVVIAILFALENARRGSRRLMLYFATPALLAGLAVQSSQQGYLGTVFAGGDDSDSLRMTLALRAARSVLSEPLTGVGPGNFERLASSLPRFGSQINIHNSFLEMAVAYGALPGVLLLFLVWSLLKRVPAIVRDGSPLGLVSLAALGSVLIGGAAASSMLGDSAWWMAMAVACLASDQDVSGMRSAGD